MVKKTTIRENIKQLCKLYNDAPTPKYELYYAKLAIIELCGWIEESQDDLVRRCAKKNLKEIANIKAVESTIKTNYGFQYDQHFRKMLISVIGLKHVERLEKVFNPAAFVPFEASLKGLKDPRNSQAHTHISGVTLRIDAPSATLNNFNTIYTGLFEIKQKMSKLKLI